MPAAANSAASAVGAESSSDGPRSAKQSKIGEAIAAPAAATFEVTWTVCCMDGTTFSVSLPEHTPVAEAKRAIGTLQEVSQVAFELFVAGREEPLDDEKRLSSADKVPLFMLLKPTSDRLALEALFKSCGGAGWTQKGGWMTDAALGDWFGVTVDDEGRVVRLELHSNNLAGPLPSEIQQLSALQKLVLYSNKLSGALPAELGQLGVLTELYLSRNLFSGQIPVELSQLGVLTVLGLSANAFSGPIPGELGQLSALMLLTLSSNALTGRIPAELGQLRSLEQLDLDRNKLSGPIPVELGQLPVLSDLNLHTNQLSGLELFRSYMEEHNPDCEVGLVFEEADY
jgi:Leucine-rich repeat (LRR) protein